MARILARKPDLGNRLGLHYSRFPRYSTFPAQPNQLLAPYAPHEKRGYTPPIREIGLTVSITAATASLRAQLTQAQADQKRITNSSWTQ